MVLILGKTKEGSHKRQQDMYSTKCFFPCDVTLLLQWIFYRSSCILKGVSVGGRGIHKTTSAQQHGFVNESDIVNEQK